MRQACLFVLMMGLILLLAGHLNPLGRPSLWPYVYLIVITTANIPSADEHEPIYDLIEKYIAPAVQAL